MIRINDRRDPQQGSTVLHGAEVVDESGDKRSILVPQGQFVSRLGQTPDPASRFNIAIGNPEAPEGVEPSVWLGVVESWRPQGSKVLIVCRPARTVEEGIHT